MNQFINKISTFSVVLYWIALLCVVRFSTYFVHLLNINLWADSVLTGLQWRPLWETWACRCAGLCPWWGTNKHWQPRQLLVFCRRESQRQHLAVRVDVPAQGSQPALPVQGAHVDGDTGGHVGNVAAAGQRLQSRITELLDIKTRYHCQEIYEHQVHVQFKWPQPLHLNFTADIRFSFLLACWRGSRWWGYRQGWSWQSTWAWWRPVEGCRALDPRLPPLTTLCRAASKQKKLWSWPGPYWWHDHSPSGWNAHPGAPRSCSATSRKQVWHPLKANNLF